MANANKHITPSMRKACEGCGTSDGRKSKGFCRTCTLAHRKIIKALNKRHSKGSGHLPPRLVASRPKRSLDCRECGVTHVYTPSFGEAERLYCSRACQKRSSDRVRTKIRRAITRGVHVQAVDPTSVFDRDGWQCQMCGCKTPRSKRGTYENKAPELDHIMPLSLGGEHSYRNTQCLCRGCNAIKSDVPMGQLSLL